MYISTMNTKTICLILDRILVILFLFPLFFQRLYSFVVLWSNFVKFTLLAFETFLLVVQASALLSGEIPNKIFN